MTADGRYDHLSDWDRTGRSSATQASPRADRHGVNIPEEQNLVIDIRYAPVVDIAGPDSFQAYLGSNAVEFILTQPGLQP